MRIGLLNLPVELLEFILDHADPRDKKTFYRLTLVNKALNSLATSRLYHTVAFKNPAITRPGVMLRRFISSILSSPERASMVREFELSSELSIEKTYFPAQPTADQITTLVSRFTPDSLLRQVWETSASLIMDSSLREHRYELLLLYAAICLPNLARMAFEGSTNQRVWDLLEAVLETFGADENNQPNAVIWPALEEVIIEGMLA